MTDNGDVGSKLGTVDLSKLTDEQALTVLKLAGEGKIAEYEMKRIIECAPHFASVTISALNSLNSVAENAGSSQKDALSTISNAISSLSGALSILSNSANSDATREKIAQILVEIGKQYVEFAKIVKDMNKDNNNLWRSIGIFVVGIVAVGVTSVGGYFVLKDKA